MAEIAQMARDFSLWLNSTYPPDLDQEAVHWRRVLKVAEEAGEVREAMGAWVHENPRKPAGTAEDVIKELADCVGAALGAIEHLTGHNGLSLEIATERVRFVCERVGVVGEADTQPERLCLTHGGSPWPLAESRCAAGDPWDDGLTCSDTQPEGAGEACPNCGLTDPPHYRFHVCPPSDSESEKP